MPGPDLTLTLSPAEMHVVRNALKAFLSDFGHDEEDVVDAIRGVLAKVDAVVPTPCPVPSG